MPFFVTELDANDQPKFGRAQTIRRFEDGTEVIMAEGVDEIVQHRFETIEEAVSKALAVQLAGGATIISGDDGTGPVEMNPAAGRAFLKAIRDAGPAIFDTVKPTTRPAVAEDV
jgi:hypothetical protein